MRPPLLGALILATSSVVAPSASADAPKAWCAPEVSELSDHVCYLDGGTPADGRRTLVIYLHGALATRPGFAYMQQRAMATHAKKHAFTVLIPTGPSDGVGYVWPSSAKDRKKKEPEVLKNLQQARAAVEKRVGHPFDETFVVGFSSGAYYGSSLAIRSALDVDGYIVLAGGSSWAQRGDGGKRAPVFVGVSAADPLSASHSRGLVGALRAMDWTCRAEERNAGHGVDGTFMAHGIRWLREQRDRAKAPQQASNP